MEDIYIWSLHENCLRIFVEGLHIWSSVIKEQNPQPCAGAKKHRSFSPEQTAFFEHEKIPFFRTVLRMSWITQKAQLKNITTKKKNDKIYIPEDSPQKSIFLELF